VIFFIFMECY